MVTNWKDILKYWWCRYSSLCIFQKGWRRKNTIPSGTVVVTDFYNVSTVASSLGGDWEELGKLYFDTDDNNTLEFYAYKKS